MNKTNMDLTHKKFVCLMEEYYLKTQSSLDLLPPTHEYRNCISMVSFIGKQGVVRVFFGAPEWHLEPQIESYDTTWDFADVVSVFPVVRDWLQEYGKFLNEKMGNTSKFEREVALFYCLLSEMMPCIREFAWISINMQYKEMRDPSLTMTHDEAVAKLASFKESLHEKAANECFRNQVIIPANAAWEKRDYAKYVACVSSSVNSLTKTESAKLYYSKKRLSKTET